MRAAEAEEEWEWVWEDDGSWQQEDWRWQKEDGSWQQQEEQGSRQPAAKRPRGERRGKHSLKSNGDGRYDYRYYSKAHSPEGEWNRLRMEFGRPPTKEEQTWEGDWGESWGKKRG